MIKKSNLFMIKVRNLDHVEFLIHADELILAAIEVVDRLEITKTQKVQMKIVSLEDVMNNSFESCCELMFKLSDDPICKYDVYKYAVSREEETQFKAGHTADILPFVKKDKQTIH